MYFLHLSTVTVSQNFNMPFIISTFVVGFISRLRNSYGQEQKFCRKSELLHMYMHTCVHVHIYIYIEWVLTNTFKHISEYTQAHTYVHTLNSCHRFSIGLASSDSGGVFHHLIPRTAKNAAARRDVCFGSLSCINLWLCGYTVRINGTKCPSSIRQ